VAKWPGTKHQATKLRQTQYEDRPNSYVLDSSLDHHLLARKADATWRKQQRDTTDKQPR
jgi:hypothetical protein